MNKKFKKICLITIPIVATILAICGAIFLWRFFTKEHYTITIRYDDKKEFTIYDSDDGKFSQIDSNLIEGGSIFIENNVSDITSISVYIENNGMRIDGTTLVGKGKRTLDLSRLDDGDYTLYFSVAKDEASELFVTSPHSFEEALTNVNHNTFISAAGTVTPENMGTDNMDFNYVRHTITMLSDINYDSDITIRKPFIWKTNGHKFSSDHDLIFTDNESIDSTVTIINDSADSISVKNVFCHTPEWSYDIVHTFNNFTETNFFYINAHDINDHIIDTKKIYVDTNDELALILKDAKLDIKDYTRTVILGKKVTMEGMNGIVLDAPDKHLIWEGDNAPAFNEIECHMLVKSYNDTYMSKYIGGEGICSFVRGSIDGIKLTVDGNYLNGIVGYSDDFDIENATITGTYDGECTGEIIKEDDNYYYVLTDKDGKTKGYKLNITEKDYSLPVINIITEGNAPVNSKETYITGTFSIDYKGYEGSDTFAIVENSTMNIRGRGHSTWEHDKKPYKIKFNSKTSLFGLEKSKEWVLLANHVDKSLLRNTLAFSVGQVLDNMLFVPHSFSVDVFVNGEYMGVYTLSEQIEIKEGRIPGEKDSTEIDTDYLLEFGGDKETTSFGDNSFASKLTWFVVVKEPDAEILTYEQFKYVTDYIDKVDESILDGTYEELIDVDSFIDWFILNELSFNVDSTLRRSDFFLKKKGGKLYAATPWDYDYAFGNFIVDGGHYDEWLYDGTYTTDNHYSGKYIRENWYTHLMEDAAFRTKLKARWEEIKEELYTTGISTIEKSAAENKVSATDNFTIWNILGKKVQWESKETIAISTYEGQVEYLKTFFIDRYNWMDKTISAF